MTFTSRKSFFSWLIATFFKENSFSYFLLKGCSFWVIQNSCDLSPSTEDFVMLKNVKLMFNMKQSKEYSKQFATFNSRIFLFNSISRPLWLDLPTTFFPLKKLVKYSQFCINPIHILFLARVVRWLFSLS